MNTWAFGGWKIEITYCQRSAVGFERFYSQNQKGAESLKEFGHGLVGGCSTPKVHDNKAPLRRSPTPSFSRDLVLIKRLDESRYNFFLFFFVMELFFNWPINTGYYIHSSRVI